MIEEELDKNEKKTIKDPEGENDKKNDIQSEKNVSAHVIKRVFEKWNNNINLIKNKFVKKRLTLDEERNLVYSIRFSHLSHSDLISLSIDPVMTEYKDLILLGLSFRLNAYENIDKIGNIDKNINFNPRKYLKDQNTYLGNYFNKGKFDNDNNRQNKKKQ